MVLLLDYCCLLYPGVEMRNLIRYIVTIFGNLIEFVKLILLSIFIIFSLLIIGVLLALLAIPVSLIIGILFVCCILVDTYVI